MRPAKRSRRYFSAVISPQGNPLVETFRNFRIVYEQDPKFGLRAKVFDMSNKLRFTEFGPTRESMMDGITGNIAVIEMEQQMESLKAKNI